MNTNETIRRETYADMINARRKYVAAGARLDEARDAYADAVANDRFVAMHAHIVQAQTVSFLDAAHDVERTTDAWTKLQAGDR